MSSARSASTSLVWMVGLAVIGLAACNQTSGLQSPTTDEPTTPAAGGQATPAPGGRMGPKATVASSDPVALSRFEDTWRRFAADAGEHYGLKSEQLKSVENILQSCLARAGRHREQYEQEKGRSAAGGVPQEVQHGGAADLEMDLIKLNDELISRLVAVASVEQVERAADAGFQAPQYLDPKPRPEVGYTAPPFKLSTHEKETADLEALRGKVVVLHFWASWCSYCKKSLPEIQKLHEAIKDNPRVTLYGINCRQRPGGTEPLELAKELGCTYPLILAGDAAAAAYEVKSFPVLFVVGPDGKIIHLERGFKTEVKERLVPVIEKALRQADAQKAAA